MASKKSSGIPLKENKMKALLFINGDAPKEFPDVEEYDLIASTDGAFNYLKSGGFDVCKLDFISGDFDSCQVFGDLVEKEKIIYTPDQDFTDFHKALKIIQEKGFTEVDVYGGSGGEMDHFLGNLSVAYGFKNDLKILFFDEYSTYFFTDKSFTLEKVRGRMISLYPFPVAEGINSKGLNWEYNGGSLSQLAKIGTRNFAVEDEVLIDYKSGDLLVFVGQIYRQI